QTVVGRARVVNVAEVGARAVLSVVVGDDPARAGGDVAPAHVSPVGGEHGGEVAAGRLAGAREGRADGDRLPALAAAGRALHQVRPAAQPARALVHAGDEDGAVGAGRDLDVADEGAGVDDDRRRPGRAAVV